MELLEVLFSKQKKWFDFEMRDQMITNADKYVINTAADSFSGKG